MEMGIWKIDTYFEMGNSRSKLVSFRDLDVYQRLYELMKHVLIEVVPKLPQEEKFDLADQLRRASKAGPALLAEGFSKRYQKRQWSKYLTDTIGECNEMVHHLSVCVDVYGKYVDVVGCRKMIDGYDVCCKQLSRLGQVWQNYHDKKTK